MPGARSTKSRDAAPGSQAAIRAAPTNVREAGIRASVTRQFTSNSLPLSPPPPRIGSLDNPSHATDRGRATTNPKREGLRSELRRWCTTESATDRCVGRAVDRRWRIFSIADLTATWGCVEPIIRSAANPGTRSLSISAHWIAFAQPSRGETSGTGAARPTWLPKTVTAEVERLKPLHPPPPTAIPERVGPLPPD